MSDTRPLVAQRYNRQEGFTLLEVIVVAGLSCLMVVGIWGLFGMLFVNSSESNLVSTRIIMAASLRRSIADVKTLQNSLIQPENTAFKTCVCGSASGGLCVSGQSAPFSLYGPGVVAPKSNLSHFDSQGSPCNAAAASCLIEVETDFIAGCAPILPSANPTAPASCSNPAEFVGVLFTIRQNLASVGNGVAFKAISGSAFTLASNIYPTGGCP